ncbi:hypothetical protein [Methylobacterium sp. J-070]|uniref:hypothetical protein n=1 Tax=Methylobacterium sp. J-070 TaxID=2836650 RepID=UPI001FB8A490|nr:hypothetical protein [Methylobacterium sp. J-070]MCJ2053996.1 hypothetical protein [Methylobacterium sp. J-070]
MAGSATVAVEATEERYRALKHMPSQIGFELDGTARWPADQFTFRLRDEGAIRLLEDLHESGAPAAAAQASTAPAGAPAATEHQE